MSERPSDTPEEPEVQQTQDEQAAQEPEVVAQAPESTAPAGEMEEALGLDDEETFEVLDEEARAVSEASERPAVGGAPDGSDRDDGQEPSNLVWMFAVLVIALIAWFGGSAIYQLRQDVKRLDARLDLVLEEVETAEQRRTRASIERARADLASARYGVTDEQQAELDRADTLLRELSKDLEPSR